MSQVMLRKFSEGTLSSKHGQKFGRTMVSSVRKRGFSEKTMMITCPQKQWWSKSKVKTMGQIVLIRIRISHQKLRIKYMKKINKMKLLNRPHRRHSLNKMMIHRRINSNKQTIKTKMIAMFLTLKLMFQRMSLFHPKLWIQAPISEILRRFKIRRSMITTLSQRQRMTTRFSLLRTFKPQPLRSTLFK